MYQSNPNLKVCRVCLETDSKLIDLYKCNLADTFCVFFGVPISQLDGLPKYICVLCYVQLMKSVSFQKKCRDANVLMGDNLAQLTTAYIKSLDTSKLKVNLKKTEIVCVSYPENEIFTVNKNDTENEFYFENEDSFEAESQVETSVKPEEDLPFAEAEPTQAKINKNIHKEFNENYLKDPLEPDKKVFYEYVFKKYGKNDPKKSSFNDRNFKFESIRQNDSDIFKCTDTGSKKITKNEILSLTGTRKRFHEYVVKKITKKSISKTKEVKDVSRMKETKKKNKKHGRTEDDFTKFAKTYNVDIKILNREEQIEDVISAKETEKYKNAKYKCELCYRGFMAEKAFQNHMVIHDLSTGPFECEICHARFTIKGRMTKHILMRHKYKFQCKLCNNVTRNSTFAREHYKCHEGHKYECEHCGKVFSKYGSRINHIRIFHGSVTCDVCSESFAGESGLLAHKTKAHRQLFKCKNCGVQFHNSNALEKHTASLANDICGAHIRPCTQCGDNLQSEELLKQHNQDFHNKKRNRYTQQKLLKLDVQQRPNVKWVSKPRSRSNVPSGETETENTDDSARRKERDNRLMCEMCAADGFASTTVLRYHQRIHTGEKPHRCPHCDKSFRIGDQLQKHLRTHTGDRPYKCSLCPKAFKTAPAHYTHQLVHTKIRRHRCHLCDKMFQTSTCVKIHIKSVHMKQPARRPKQTDIQSDNDNNVL